MAIIPSADFASAAFLVTPGEDEETNPGIFGQSLAWWLSRQLRARGISAGEVYSEDFGWCVPVEVGAVRTFLACGPIDEGDELREGERCWRIIVSENTGLLGLFSSRGTRAGDEQVVQLHRKVCDLLRESPGVRGLREDLDS